MHLNQMLTKWFKKQPSHVEQLATLLAQTGNRESFLGTKPVTLPTPDDIRKDAAKLARYSEASDYKVFADEAWSRIISHLDTVLDDKASAEKKAYHCGALKATLDLLRLSYQARSLMDSIDKQHDASLQQ